MSHHWAGLCDTPQLTSGKLPGWEALWFECILAMTVLTDLSGTLFPVGGDPEGQGEPARSFVPGSEI
jgi:hypothetical protein